MTRSMVKFVVSRSGQGLGRAVHDAVPREKMRMHTYGCKDQENRRLVFSAHPGSNRSGYISQ